MKEICICAAIKLKDKRIFRGHRHYDCYRAAYERGISPDDCEEGFITSKNRFVGREEGWKLQKLAGIKSIDSLRKARGVDERLFSEDLY